jgi:hypothetical protein
MRWAIGTVTEIDVEGDEVIVTDIDPSGRLQATARTTRRSVSETLDLADEHDDLARQLRAAARRAWANQNRKGS